MRAFGASASNMLADGGPHSHFQGYGDTGQGMLAADFRATRHHVSKLHLPSSVRMRACSPDWLAAPVVAASALAKMLEDFRSQTLFRLNSAGSRAG